MATVTFDTEKFGTIEVDEANIIQFVAPILGFDHDHRFTLLPHRDESPFLWLQSMDSSGLSFVVTSPAQFNVPYEIEIPENVVETLAIEAAEEVIVLTLVTIPDGNPSLMTTNLLAPIVINQRTMKAMQIVLDNPAFDIRYRLIPDDALTGPSREPVLEKSSDPA